MSSNNPESQGQDWPIYPGTPGPQGGSTPQPSRNQFSEPVEERRSSEPPYRSSSSEPPYRSSSSEPPYRSSSSEPVEERRSSEPPYRSSSSEPVEERYAQDDAYRAYQSYVHPQPTDPRQISGPVEGQPRRPSVSRPSSSSALQKKYVWIAIGIVAAVVITSIARGGFSLWPLIIFGAIAWWIVGHKRKC